MDPLSIMTTYDSLAQVALNVFRNSWSIRRTNYYNELNKSVNELSVSITRMEASLVEELKAAGSSEEERPHGRVQRSHSVGERRFPCPIISKDEMKKSSAGHDSKYRQAEK
jgi:xanthine dehydrogenase molybdopterin-binding subunit B